MGMKALSASRLRSGSRSSRNSTGEAKECAAAAPDDLDANAEQDEGRQSDQHVGAADAEHGNHRFGKTIAEIDGRGDRREAGNSRAAEEGEIGQTGRRLRPLAAE